MNPVELVDITKSLCYHLPMKATGQHKTTKTKGSLLPNAASLQQSVVISK
jgi:hypothetical protein